MKFLTWQGRCQYGSECKFEHPAPPVHVQSVVRSGSVSGVGQFPAPYGAAVTNPLLVVPGEWLLVGTRLQLHILRSKLASVAVGWLSVTTNRRFVWLMCMCNLTGAGTSAPEAALSNYLMKDLPPSLRPPPEGGYPQLFPVDWG